MSRRRREPTPDEMRDQLALARAKLENLNQQRDAWLRVIRAYELLLQRETEKSG